MLFEEKYPGNEVVMQKLLTTIDEKGVTAFTGAGTSMPDLPGWARLIEDLIDSAKKEGRIDSLAAEGLMAEKSDVLYVVDEIYNAIGKPQTRALVSKTFSSLKEPTDAHNKIVMTNFQRLMTLNYDNGLEMALAEIFHCHSQSITPRHVMEVDNWLRGGNAEGSLPILHWHGVASDVDSIILAGSDYVEFYDTSSNNKDALRNIFKTHSLLMIGFGFSDPFIERELNSVLQPLPNSNMNFAIIGVTEGEIKNLQIERRKYATKFKLEVIFYPVAVSDSSYDHSGLLNVLSYLSEQRPKNFDKRGVVTVAEPSSGKGAINYRSNLFTIGDQPIYCEPNVWTRTATPQGTTEEKISFSDIMASEDNCCISAPHEYGLSSLGRRIVVDLNQLGRKALFRDARNFPKHRKAILSDPDFADIQISEKFTLVLDNFSILEHQRCVRELVSTYENLRIVVLQKNVFGGSIDDDFSELNFKLYHLSGLSRSDIRNVINKISPLYNIDTASTVVDKVYNDLLQLCIPLTPSNVIMYASVLCKDGSFSPVSRLHIVDRFTSEAVRRASDAYADSFNSMNKLDLISAFCFQLFDKGVSSFLETEWRAFCAKYKKDNLVDFSTTEILGDLLDGRIIAASGSLYVFRYRMFFSYFVGRYLSFHPAQLFESISQNSYLELDGLVEVLCGLMTDCSIVLQDLTSKLNSSLKDFYNSYPIQNIDFHEGLKWESNDAESDLWENISGKIDSGPVSTGDLDELKTSIHAERRTEDQKISIIKFIASEKSVARSATYLCQALESAKHANAAAKKEAALAVMDAHVLAYEVATVFVPLIAERKYFSWNGFTYINLIEDDTSDLDDVNQLAKKERMQNMVAYALPFSIGRNIADHFGSRKLGQVFIALSEDKINSSSLKKFILYCLLIRSKPSGWLSSAKKRLSDTKRDDIYLKHMLQVSMRQFKNELNTEEERSQLKELVATIRLRREVNIKVPSSTAIKKAIGQLEEGGLWKDHEAEVN